MKKPDLLFISLLLVSVLATAQSLPSVPTGGLAGVQQSTNQGVSIFFEVAKYSLSIVGLIGCSVLAYNIFAKGQNSWQYIGTFIMMIIILIAGGAMFAR